MKNLDEMTEEERMQFLRDWAKGKEPKPDKGPKIKTAINVIIAIIILLIIIGLPSNEEEERHCRECGMEIAVANGLCANCIYKEGYQNGYYDVYDQFEEKYASKCEEYLIPDSSLYNVIMKHFDGDTTDDLLDEIWTEGVIARWEIRDLEEIPDYPQDEE